MSTFAGALHPALVVSTHGKSKTSPSASVPQTPPPKTKRDQSVSSSGSGGKRGRRGVSIEEFEFLKPISKGAFGRVYLGRKRVSGDLFAIKVLDKETMIRKNMLTHVMAERRALALANTPFVVRLYYAFMSSRHLFLEYMIGGDLSSLLAAIGSFSKEMALFYTAEITAAVDYLHAASITHRDLKPDNVLIGADGHIKLTDFGLSKVAVKDQDPAFGNVDPVKSLSRFSSVSRDKPDRVHHSDNRRSSGDRDCLGTPDYLAVELLLGIGHGPSVDYWALGCCLFEFMAGYPPFTDESPELIFKNILNHGTVWPLPTFLHALPDDARDLIIHLLESNPQQRFAAADIKAHPFFATIDWSNISSLAPPFIPQPDDEKDTGYFDARNASRNIDVTRFSFYEAQAVDSGTFGRVAGAASATSDTGTASFTTATSSPTLDPTQSMSLTSDSAKESRRRSAISAANQRRRSKLVDSCQAASGSSESDSSPESPSAAFVASPGGGGETMGAVDAQLEEFIAWKNVDVLGSLNQNDTVGAGSTTGSLPDS
ncbi:kinase-like domain-containing protein [Catenaria anguillulae PL171]|uniref:non-specific serine/threonine protein kinase n=1 Tax=Catenaria anguillulae PL171 TaxID=765915 RepID=A0A1Y2HFJ7_9FUNG|nr:kinase-like domain-containing protein [Catenaria anguillulae PL171]